MGYMSPFPRGTRKSQVFKSRPGAMLNGVQVNPLGGHTGDDYVVAVGTPIRAPANGIIRNSSWLTANYRENEWWLTRYGGDTIVLDCTDAFGRSEGYPTFVYAHCLDSTLPVGARVVKGQIMGYSGNSGTATTGAHCHVEKLPPKPWNMNNGVYGRVDPVFDEYYEGGLAAQGTITEEDEVTAIDVAQAVMSWPIERTDRVGKEKSTVAMELAKIGPDQQDTQKLIREQNKLLTELPQKIAEAVMTHSLKLVTGQDTNLLTELGALRPDIWAAMAAIGGIQLTGDIKVDTEAMVKAINDDAARRMSE